MKSCKKIRTALIGAGNMGKNHARVYSGISNFIAVADINPEIGQAIADTYHIAYYADYREMLEKESIDALSVVVPTVYHAKVAIDCLSHRIPLLIEKPIATTISEAKEILAAAKQYKTFYMVGHIERFNPGVIALKKLVTQQKLGKIISILTIRVGVAPPNTPHSDVALDLGIHDVDICNYLLDEYPKKTTVLKNRLFTTNVADAASIFLEYKSTTASIQTNWITPIKMRKLFITGTNGYAELDYIQQKLTVYDKIMNVKPDGDFLKLLSVSDIPKKEVYISKKEPLKEELVHFLRSRKSAIFPTKYAIKALELVQ